MMSKFVIFLAFNLLLTPIVSTLKPTLNPTLNPSPTILIVNHLNYLRYDYLSDPTSHRTNNYPFYSGFNSRSLTNNRSDDYYQLDQAANFDLILNGHLDVELSNNLQATVQLNEDSNNNLPDQLDLNNAQSNRSSVNISLQSVDTDAESSSQLSTVPLTIDHSNSDQSTKQTDNQNTDQTNQLVNNLNDDLIITNTIEGQQRLNELNLLQQTEPSISIVLDADLPFLNDIHQDSNSPFKSNERTNETSIESTTNDDTLTDSFLTTELSNQNRDNLDDLIDNSNFDLAEFLRSGDENLNSSSNTNSDLFCPDNIDDLATRFHLNGSLDFLDNCVPLINQDDAINDFSDILIHDPNINNNALYTSNNSDHNEATCSASASNNPNESDNYIHEYLLEEEDLQILNFPDLASPIGDDTVEASGINDIAENQTSEDCIEVSSDSAISSMSRCSDWFESGSDSSSHFDDQFVNPRELERRLNNDQQRSRCTSASANSNELFNNFDLIDTNYDLHSREDVFDDQILNFEDSTSSLNPISFISQDDDQNIPLQTVLHNHTYANVCDSNEDAATSSSSITQSKSATSTRAQTVRSNRAQSESFDTIRNRRLLEDSLQNFDLISLTSETSSADEMSRSLSRDEKKAKELQIPISVCEIINMPIDEYNECLSKHELNEKQLTLIRDIRRRGKNKVAAQNCRKRKINQIIGLQSEVEHLQIQKSDLYSYHQRMASIKSLAENKYQKLYDFIWERTQDNAALLNNFEMNFRMANVKRNNSDNEGAVGGDEVRFDENNTNRLNEMSSTGDSQRSSI